MTKELPILGRFLDLSLAVALVLATSRAFADSPHRAAPDQSRSQLPTQGPAQAKPNLASPKPANRTQRPASDKQKTTKGGLDDKNLGLGCAQP